MIFALIIKKPSNEEDDIVKEIIETESQCSSMNPSVLVERNNVKPPPQKNLLEYERARRKNLQRTQEFLKDFAFYVLFLGLIFFTIYSMQDYRAFLQSATLKDYLVTSKFKLEKVMLISISNFWNRNINVSRI